MSARIFISYSTKNRNAADAVVTALSDAGLSAWLDRKEIRPGDSFVERMNEGISEASYVCLLASKDAFKSKWVTREWSAALADDDIVLLPMKIEPCELPPLIQDILYIDGSTDLTKGINELIGFLRTEMDSSIGLETLRHTDGSPLAGASRRDLRRIANHCMREVDFQAFLFDAEISEGEIKGNSLHELLVSFMHLAASDGILDHFSEWLFLERGRCVKFQWEKLKDEPRWSLD